MDKTDESSNRLIPRSDTEVDSLTDSADAEVNALLAIGTPKSWDFLVFPCVTCNPIRECVQCVSYVCTTFPGTSKAIPDFLRSRIVVWLLIALFFLIGLYFLWCRTPPACQPLYFLPQDHIPPLPNLESDPQNWNSSSSYYDVNFNGFFNSMGLSADSASVTQYSSMECIGGYVTRGRGREKIDSSANDRTCLFHNVCFNEDGDHHRLLYYQNPQLPPEPLFVQDGIYVDFPVKFVNSRHWISLADSDHEWLSPTIVRTAIPSTAGWSNIPVHVLYTQFWPENFGHALGDDVFPTYQLMTQHGVLTRDVQILGTGPCEYGDQKKIACRITKELFALISDRPWQRFEEYLGNADAAVFRAATPKCVRQLLVGHALRGMIWDGRGWAPFMSYLMKGFSREVVETKPQQLQILITKKSNRRKIVNLDAIVEHLRDVFGLPVKVWEPHTMTLMQQAIIVRENPVLVTPCGGISFAGAFMYPGSSIVYIDWYNPLLNRTDFMEEYVWQFDPRFTRYHYSMDREEVIPVDDLEKVQPGLNISIEEREKYIWRNWADSRLNLDKITYFVFHALVKAMNKLQLPAGRFNIEQVMHKMDHFRSIAFKSWNNEPNALFGWVE